MTGAGVTLFINTDGEFVGGTPTLGRPPLVGRIDEGEGTTGAISSTKTDGVSVGGLSILRRPPLVGRSVGGYDGEGVATGVAVGGDVVGLWVGIFVGGAVGCIEERSKPKNVRLNFPTNTIFVTQSKRCTYTLHS